MNPTFCGGEMLDSTVNGMVQWFYRMRTAAQEHTNIMTTKQELQDQHNEITTTLARLDALKKVGAKIKERDYLPLERKLKAIEEKLARMG